MSDSRQNPERDTIIRERIDYLRCAVCGVVFADRSNPQNPTHCPICAATREHFTPHLPDGESEGDDKHV